MVTASFKASGDMFYKEGQYQSAAVAYSKAVSQSSQTDPDLHKLLSNRCACYLHLNKLREALEDAEQCVILQPTWAKSHSRLASCLLRQNRIFEAYKACEQGLKLDATNTDLLTMRTKCERILNSSGSGGGGPSSSRTSSSSQSSYSSTPRNCADSNRSADSSPSFLSNIVATVLDWLSLLLRWWGRISDSDKTWMAMLLVGAALTYYAMFTGEHNYGYGFPGYYDGGSMHSFSGGFRLSWPMWIAIVAAGYKLPPMFPRELGDYARPFFGLNVGTFIWLLNFAFGSGSGGGLLRTGYRRPRSHYD